jgi:hypothetical protein
MIATKPAVQKSCSHVKRFVCYSSHASAIRQSWEKRNANRRHRRALNRATRQMLHDPERWWSEGFNAPSLSSWDLW